MKKNVQIKSILILVLMLLISCNASNDEEEQMIEEEQQEESNANCESATGYITKEEALKMERLYVDNQYDIINKNMSDEPDYRDNRVVSFTIEEIECYFDRAKAKALEKGYDASKMRVRIYFAAKPDEVKKPKSTVFLVTTVKDTIKGFAPANFDEGGYYNYGNAGDGTDG